MPELQQALIEAVSNANTVVQESVERANYWTRRRNELAQVAYVGGAPIEAIAVALGENIQTVRSWIDETPDTAIESRTAI